MRERGDHPHRPQCVAVADRPPGFDFEELLALALEEPVEGFEFLCEAYRGALVILEAQFGELFAAVIAASAPEEDAPDSDSGLSDFAKGYMKDLAASRNGDSGKAPWK
jgi:hypothetical protein